MDREAEMAAAWDAALKADGTLPMSLLKDAASTMAWLSKQLDAAEHGLEASRPALSDLEEMHREVARNFIGEVNRLWLTKLRVPAP